MINFLAYWFHFSIFLGLYFQYNRKQYPSVLSTKYIIHNQWHITRFISDQIVCYITKINTLFALLCIEIWNWCGQFNRKSINIHVLASLWLRLNPIPARRRLIAMRLTEIFNNRTCFLKELWLEEAIVTKRVCVCVLLLWLWFMSLADRYILAGCFCSSLCQKYMKIKWITNTCILSRGLHYVAWQMWPS